MASEASSSSGLFSNVFSFVSRELESFVTTATGGEPPKRTSSSSRSGTKPYDKSKRTKKHKHDTSKKEKDVEGTRREQGQVAPPPPRRRRSKSPAMPPPPVPAHALKKKTSVTMPGSFFPRSPSLEPDYATSLSEGQVRSLGVVMSNDQFMREVRNDAGPSRTPGTPRLRRKSNSSVQSEPSPSPIAISGGPSVRGVVDRFTDDADPSLMLPNNIISPERTISSPRSQAKSAKAKGKERDLGEWEDEFSFSGDTSGEIRVRGIEQELLAAREEHYRNEMEQDPDSSVYVEQREQDQERIRTLEEEVAKLKHQLAEQLRASRMDPPPAPVPPPPPPLWASSTIPSALRNLVKPGATASFLTAARASLRPTSLPVEAPINPAVYGSATRRSGVPTLHIPTEKMAAFLSEVKSAKLKKVANRQPPRRVEADPNDSSFNMSSASIRRDILRDLVERDRLERSMSFDFDSDSHIGEKRKRTDDEDRSLKRRATEPFFSDSSTSSASSAPSVPFTDSQGSSSSAGTYRSWPTASNETEVTTPSLCSDNENDPEAEQAEDKLLATPPETQTESPPTRRQVFEIHDEEEEDTPESPERPSERETTPSPPQKPISIQQPQPVSGTKRNPFSKRIPSSPLPSATPKKPVGPGRQKARTASQQKALTVAQGVESDEEVLVPASPTKVKKITAKPFVFKFQPIAGPSRIPRRQESKDTSVSASRKEGSQSRESSRPVSRAPSSASLRNPNTSTGSASSQPVPGPSRPGSVPATHHVQRRRTLDEELRRAGDRLWQEADDEAEDDDLESGILVAMGTRKRKGFLAKGGSAGVPVYMGSGYVQGAEDDDDDDDEL